jgi:hypothetical protein
MPTGAFLFPGCMLLQNRCRSYGIIEENQIRKAEVRFDPIPRGVKSLPNRRTKKMLLGRKR